MICPECETRMIIDEWGGWRWLCFNCEYEGRLASPEEIKQWEKENERYYKAN